MKKWRKGGKKKKGRGSVEVEGAGCGVGVGFKSQAVWQQTSSGNDPQWLCFHPKCTVCVHVCLPACAAYLCADVLSSLSLLHSSLLLSTSPATFSPPPCPPPPSSFPPSLPACQMSGAVASEWAVEGSVAAASIWSCNGVKKSGLTDRRQSHRASLKTDPLDKEIIERRRQLGGPSAFLDVFIFFSLLAPSYYVH